MIRVGVTGCEGRMGRLLCRLIAQEEGMRLVGGTEKPSRPSGGRPSGEGGWPVYDRLEPLLAEADVILDFTSAALSVAHLEAAGRQNSAAAFVIGSTGLSTAQSAFLKEEGGRRRLLYGANMSLGVAALKSLVEKAAVWLRSFDAEIVEMHHRHKKDAPSGTAMSLAAALTAARRSDFETAAVFGRPRNGPRRPDDLGLSSLRGGSVIGDHTVIFAGEGERLELTHRADDRSIFAHGALKAARWLISQPNGFYGIEDVFSGIAP